MKALLLTLISLLSLTGYTQNDPEIFNAFKSTFIEVDGYKINVETLGEGAPIFFFPGGPGNSHDYMQGAFGHYHKTHKVVFIDFLGRGMSDDAKNKSEYSIDNDVYITEQIRKKLNLDKIAIVGHSYGTVIAQAYAVAHPEQVSKMVLIAGFHSAEMWQNNCDNYNYQAKTHFPDLWKKVDSLRALGYVSQDSIFKAAYSVFPTKYIYYHDVKTKGNNPKQKYRSWNEDVYYNILGRDADFLVGGSMIAYDVRRDLIHLDFPTLIIAGRYDGVSTPLFNFQYKTLMPQAQFEMFENSAHNPYREEKERFYQIFDQFFDLE